MAERITWVLDAKNQASPAFAAVNQSATQLNQTSMNLTRMLGGLAATVSVAKLTAWTVETARASANNKRLGTSFDQLARQANETGDRMLAGLQRASGGAVNSTDLMLAANKAMLLDVADTTQEMTQLMEVARARGQAMGLSTTAAFSDIVTGIGRMSPLILDNLGIVVDADQAYARYADSIGKTADRLTDGERKQAMLNAVLASSRDLVLANAAAGDDAALSFERAMASMADARLAIGDLFAEDVAVGANNLSNAIQSVTGWLEKLREAGDGLGGQSWMEAMYDPALDTSNMKRRENVALLAENTAGFGALTDSVVMSAAAADEQGAATARAAAGLRQLGGEASAAGPQLANLGLEARLAGDEFDMLYERTMRLRSGLSSIAVGMVPHMGAEGTAAWLKEQEATLAIYQDNWRNIAGHSDEYIDNVLTPAYLNTLRDQSSELDKAQRSVAQMPSAVKQVNAEFQKLKGTVSSVLSEALDPGVGVDPDQLLAQMGIPRPDAINENARRLADIAKNGLQGQDWLGDFAREAPNIWEMIRVAHNPQEEAARLLKEFQQGLQPELIDKGRAKALVRALILGEQSMAALAQEIAQELAAEMGIPLEQAAAAARQAMGGGVGGGLIERAATDAEGAAGGMATPGNAAAVQFRIGFEAQLVADQFGAKTVSVLEAQFKQEANVNRLRAVGGIAGAVWGEGFLSATGENIPPALIDQLLLKLLPGIQAGQAAQSARTEAQP